MLFCVTYDDRCCVDDESVLHGGRGSLREALEVKRAKRQKGWARSRRALGGSTIRSLEG